MRRISGLQERIRRRLTPAGQVLLATTFAAGLFGVDTRQTLAFQAFALGCALLLVSWSLSLRRPPALKISRQLPRHATAGEPLRLRLELENQGARPAVGLRLAELLPDPRPGLKTFLHSRAPGEHRLNPVDRLFAYPRWRWLVECGTRIRAQPPLRLPDLAPGERHQVPLDWTPLRRGVLALHGLRISRTDPLGLCHAYRELELRQPLLVLPKRYPLPPQRPPGRRRLQPGGIALAGSVGDSRELIGLRDYRPGDSPRHIHWAAWARSGAPVVKEYQDEYFSRQALILDNFAGPGRESDLEAAVSVAASFVGPLQGPDALLDLMFVANRAYTLTGGRGLMSGQALLEVLACVPAAPEDGFETLSRAVLGHAALLSACVCVLLDWDEPRQALVRGLRALGLPVRVLLVGGPQRPDPGPMADRPGNLARLDPERLEQGLAGL